MISTETSGTYKKYSKMDVFTLALVQTTLLKIPSASAKTSAPNNSLSTIQKADKTSKHCMKHPVWPGLYTIIDKAL